MFDTEGSLSNETISAVESGAVSSSFAETIQNYKNEAGLGVTKSDEPAEVLEPKELVVEKPSEESEEVPETKEVEATEDKLVSPEGEEVKFSRIADVKQWGKNWQNTANERQPAFELVQNRFGGNIEEAQASADMFELIFTTPIEELDGGAVFTELANLSKPRAEKLIQWFADNPAVQAQAETAVVSKLFGDGVNSENIQEELEGYKLFKQLGGLSALLDEDGELPATLQYDLEGNPRSDEEVNLFKQVLGELKSINEEKSKAQTEAQKRAEQERVQYITDQKSAYTDERFEAVTKTLNTLKLAEDANDPTEVKFQKARDARMIKSYVTMSISEDDNFRSMYANAMKAIENGDVLESNRLKVKLNAIVAKYTDEIVDDYISKNNIKIEKNSKEIEKLKDVRKEVDLGGGEPKLSSQRPQGESVDDAIARLIKTGQLSSNKFR